VTTQIKVDSQTQCSAQTPVLIWWVDFGVHKMMMMLNPKKHAGCSTYVSMLAAAPMSACWLQHLHQAWAAGCNTHTHRVSLAETC
jgi:hypothetical protein